MTGKTRTCVGCERQPNGSRPWCAPCELRLPSNLRTTLQAATTTLERAHTDAARWLQAHPRASARDLDILALVAQGQSNTAIADRLHLSPETVKSHLRTLSTRWGCRGRAQLVATAFGLGYLKIRKDPST